MVEQQKPGILELKMSSKKEKDSKRWKNMSSYELNQTLIILQGNIKPNDKDVHITIEEIKNELKGRQHEKRK